MYSPLLRGRLNERRFDWFLQKDTHSFALFGRRLTQLLLGIVCILGSNSIAYAQDQAVKGRSLRDYEVTPPSPTVAALGVYGNIPVSYHTGVPDINVPLYQLRVKGLTIPIALNYHSTGLQVDQRASDVGLGWTCSAVSVLGRTIMGGRADFDNGYTTRRYILPRLPTDGVYVVDPRNSRMYEYSYYALKKEASSDRREIDTEPDVYNYSLPGHTGKFVFDTLGQAHTIPYENLAIAYTGKDSDHEGFSITDEAGNRYTFGYNPQGIQGGGETTVSTPCPFCPSSLDTPWRTFSASTAFFLSQIITPYRDTITFKYEGVIESYKTPIDLTDHAFVNSTLIDPNAPDCPPIRSTANCYSTVDHFTSVLRKITHGRETIEFTYEHTPRKDLVGGAVLKGITVKYDGQLRKEFALYHSYFSTGDADPDFTASDQGIAASEHFRLRLDSVRQVGMPAWHFAYNEPGAMQLPTVHSYAQDRWGYFNNRINNKTLIVRSDGTTRANREADSTAATLTLLRRITYPTGGTSTFRYETNRIYYRFKELDEVETLAGVIAVSSRENPVDEEQDASFTLTSRRTVRLIFHFPAPTGSGYGGDTPGGGGNPDGGGAGGFDPGNGGGGTLTYGNGYATLSSADGRVIYRSDSGAGQADNVLSPFIVTLPAGTYRLHAAANGPDKTVNQSPDNFDYYSSLVVEANKQVGGNLPVGGCRIAAITHDGQNSAHPPGTTYYRYSDADGHSSGVLLAEPNLNSQLRTTTSKVERGPNDSQYELTNFCLYDVFLQSPANQVGILGSSVAAYTQVTTLTGPTSKELTHQQKYWYAVPLDRGYYTNEYPFAPPTSQEWLRGKLLKEQDFAYVAPQNYRVAREKTYAYSGGLNPIGNQMTGPGAQYPNYADVIGYRIFTFQPKSSLTNLGSMLKDINMIIPYHYESASVYLTQTQETYFDEQGNGRTTVQQFEYNAQNSLVRKEKTAVAAGDTLVRHTRYVGDYAVPSATRNPNLQALSWYQQQHMLTQPVETALYRTRSLGQAFVVKRSLSTFQLSHGLAVPARAYASDAGRVVPTVATALATVNPAVDSLVYDRSYYRLAAQHLYDAQGNVLQQALPGSRPSAYIYSYPDRLLIAETVSSSLAQVAATSFEPRATGRWRYDSVGTQHRVLGGYTGQWAYQLTGSGHIERDHLPAGEYELACWVKGAIAPTISLSNGTGASLARVTTGAAGWQYYRTRLHFTGMGSLALTASLAGPILLDELRLYPVGAQLTTYTYAPLVGITSQTDASGRTTLYEYDELGRLVRTRDEQGHILSQQQYHYAGK